jgi:hypothetical protein
VQPEEVLELIDSAPERYDTVRAALRYRGDGPTKKGIRERIVRRAFQVYPREAYRPIRHLEPDGPFEWRCRAWHADHDHWRMETEVPGGGVEISASKGRRRLPIGGPSGSGLVWNRRVGAGSREDDPQWFMLATDHYWTFYPLLTDEICGISYELRSLDLRVEGTVLWAGREAVRLRGVPGEEWDWEWDPDPLHWVRTSTRPWWMPSAACCCAVPHGWGERTSTPWRSRRSTSTSRSPRTPSPRANPYRGLSRSHPQVAKVGEFIFHALG